MSACRLLCLALPLLAPPHLPAMEARVVTREGRALTGQVRFQSNQVLVASLQAVQLHKVALSNLAALHVLQGRVGSRPARIAEESRATRPEWRNDDIGPVRLPGEARLRSGQVRLRANTLEGTGGEDSMHFAFRPLRDDGEIVARLVRLSHGSKPTRAGLMMRGSLDPRAPSVFMGQSPEGGFTGWRKASSQPATHNEHRLVHDWMRLKRDGDRFLAYTSRDTLHWRLIDEVQLQMPKAILVGCLLQGNAGPMAPRATGWFEAVRTGQGLRHHGFIPRITLESGSRLVEDLAFTAEGHLHFRGTTPLPEVPLRHTARLDFQWLPASMASRLPDGRRGALLATGEFFEGDFKSLRHGTAVISTVLFGLRRFDAHHEIVSIVLNPNAPPAALSSSRATVQTRSGSRLQGQVLHLGERGLLLREPLLGRLTVPLHDLRQVTLVPDRLAAR